VYDRVDWHLFAIPSSTHHTLQLAYSVFIALQLSLEPINIVYHSVTKDRKCLGSVPTVIILGSAFPIPRPLPNQKPSETDQTNVTVTVSTHITALSLLVKILTFTIIYNVAFAVA